MDRDPTSVARIYLDHAAATPLVPEARAAMIPYLETVFGNPSAIHREGQVAQAVIADCRTRVARCLQVKDDAVVFTSGGTESNHLAILGAATAAHNAGRPYTTMEFVTSPLEHPSVLGAFSLLRERGATVHMASVDDVGRLDLDQVASCLSEKTVLVSVAAVNSEIGVIADTGALARLLAKRSVSAVLHVDAAQAPLWLAVDMPRLGADIVSFDAGKCGGPKGVGMLAWRKGVQLAPVMGGGGQELGLRPGTESVMLIAGATTAFIQAQEGCVERAEHVMAVRDAGIAVLRAMVPGAILNGPEGLERVANNINISIPGIDTEFAVVVLDRHGIAASTKSACSGAGGGESAVVKAISEDPARARATIRLTLNIENSRADIEAVARILKTHCQTMLPYQME